MIEFLLGVIAGVYFSYLLRDTFHKDRWREGYKQGIEYARNYWKPQVKAWEENEQQRRIREWLR